MQLACTLPEGQVMIDITWARSDIAVVVAFFFDNYFLCTASPALCVKFFPHCSVVSPIFPTDKTDRPVQLVPVPSGKCPVEAAAALARGRQPVPYFSMPRERVPQG